MKKVKAVAPYNHPQGINFKTKAYESWHKIGGDIAHAHYPWRIFHKLAFEYSIPKLCECAAEARLRFVQPVSVRFDTFPDYAWYEIIPLVWDCWPLFFQDMCDWMKSHRVRTAIFTSSQTADLMRCQFPEMNVLTITEGVDTGLFNAGKPLIERSIDLVESGRPNENIISLIEDKVICEHTLANGKRRFSASKYQELLGNVKMTIALPRCMTQPQIAGDIETLTQRYWECMLSRVVMVGHAPKELTELIGYNPVIELDIEHAQEQILDILSHIEEHQSLVDHNRETALNLGSWDIRMKQVMEWLHKHGYEV